MACDPNTLLAEATCFQQCAGWPGLGDAVELVLLCAIRDGTPMACDPQVLLDEAACLLSCIPPGALQAVKIGVLCQILSGGGGGGVPLVGINYKFEAGNLYFYDTTDNSWALVGVTGGVGAHVLELSP